MIAEKYICLYTKIPCHRVVKSDGSVGDYNRGGIKIKEKILKKRAQ